MSTCKEVLLPYMPYTTASYWEQAFPVIYNVSLPLNGTFTQIELALCEPQSKEHALQTDRPLLLFSPSLGINRQFYHITCANLASQGFTIVTVDAPGQANIITYADGSVQYGNSNIVTNAEISFAVDVRAQDLKFVLDLMCSPSHSPNDRTWPAQTSTSSVGIFGHSLSGAASLSTLLHDPRIIGGADFDGGFYNSYNMFSKTTSDPFLLFASALNNQSTLSGWPEA